MTSLTSDSASHSRGFDTLTEDTLTEQSDVPVAVSIGSSSLPATGKYSNEISTVLITEADLQARIKQLAQQISAYYSGRTDKIVVLTVLKGAVLFVTDLIREIDIPTELEFMAISSYGSGMSSSGVVRILKDLDRTIDGLDILIVEDIIDSGLTLSWLMRNLATRSPHSLNVCTLLRKPEAVANARVDAKFIGFDIPNEFVVGYGLDYAESYRDMRYLGILKKEVYSQ